MIVRKFLQWEMAMRWIEVLFLSAVASMADASEIVPPDPWEIIHTARLYGEAEVGRDKMRDPLITATLADRQGDLSLGYQINFYDCRLGRNCQTVLFRARLESEDWEEAPPDLELFDAWNRGKLFGRAYWAEDGQAVLEHPVAMHAGLPKETLAATFDAWRTALNDYEEYLGISAR